MPLFLPLPNPHSMYFDVVIIGAGLTGASFAVALRASRYSVAVLESRPPPRPAAGWDRRVYALSPASARFLKELGVWKHLDTTRINPVYDMEIYGDQGGRLDFSAYQTGVGELAWIAESSLVAQELWESLNRQANITLFCPAQPTTMRIDSGEVRLSLNDGREITARLAVAADGVDSWAREAAAISADFQPYKEKGVVANFTCSVPNRGTAFQWFRADGVLAYLPLPGNLISIVWSTPDENAKELMALSEQALCDRVEQAGQSRLGSLQLVTAPVAFPLRLMRVAQTVAPRFALIGDAAHAIHPLSGHGINLGFQDARVLADVLTGLASHCDCGDLRELRRYARARSEEVWALQMATHALQRLFLPKIEPLAWLRNLGLNLTNHLPVVREMLVRYALG